jgi:Zn-dependent protease with chaperone function
VQYQRAVSYSRQTYLHYFLGSAYEFLILLILLTWNVAPRYRDWAERISSRPFVQTMLFAPLLLATIAILILPADAWGQAIERRYGRSVQSWISWLQDWAIAQAVACLVGTFLVWILYLAIRKHRRLWWLDFGLVASVFVVVGTYLSPLVFDPLFFKFTPLAPRQPELVLQIQKIVNRGGLDIPPDRMFEMNASTKLTSLNAYVTGFGISKRVVVWDTTLSNSTIPETLFVFGHEMGHYVLLHIPKQLALFTLLLLALSALGARLAVRAVTHWGSGVGIRGLHDLASLPLLLLVLSLLGFLATPIINGVSRHYEHEADRYGLEIIHGIVPDANQIAARYFRKSGSINLSDPNPDPFIKFWLFDHPSRPERIEFVSSYNPWARGESPKYVK